MLTKLPKNLLPKFHQHSKISKEINEIIYNILDNPIDIVNTFNKNSKNNLKQISSFQNKKHIAKYNYVNTNTLDNYVKKYKDNKISWAATPFTQKKDVFLKAADLIENKYYNQMIAYTILGQNKNVYEAELDSICELVDFLRFNTYYAEKMLTKQPIQTTNIENISEYNDLEGFVAAITPFNFTAIGGNLATVPLYFGNSVLWKPSDSAILSNYLFHEIMLEAGLPPGILNFCPMDGEKFLNYITKSEDLSAILFTGSSHVLETIYTKVGENIRNYNSFPKIIGESGGKNFHFIHNSFTNIDYIVEKTLESSFNYSGQKCSASSILYLPESMLYETINKLKIRLIEYNKTKHNYGLINESSYDNTIKNLCEIKNDDEVDFIVEGYCSKENNYLIEPNIIISKNHSNKVFNQEFFAPILTIYPYNDRDVNETIKLCNDSNNYALTGSIFSLDEIFTDYATNQLRHKTGNFYINDKSTGSVVGQQPFGGGGKSGTNDKAGDINMLFRMINQRNIKINKDL